jgi:glutaminyl-peptide cyclotransferase
MRTQTAAGAHRAPRTEHRTRSRSDHRVPIIILVVLMALGALWYTGYGIAQREEARRERARQVLATTGAVRFNGEAAFQRLKEQCDFGPRVPGTEGHARCLEYLASTLTPLASRVTRQQFTFKDGPRNIRMTNLIARFNPPSGPKPGTGVILAAHWDTRPTADQEPDPAKRTQPILGANDGASGVAVLLEVARMLKAKPASVPVWIVLFDGEDYGPGIDRMFLGAKHFAANLPAGVPRKGVLLDMVGDKNLEIFKEVHSVQRASAVVDSFWEVAHRLGYRAFFNPEPRHVVLDDHIPLLDQGISMIDVIDFDYPPWHTLGDTVDKCSAASLGIVGDVTATWTYEQKE